MAVDETWAVAVVIGVNVRGCGVPVDVAVGVWASTTVANIWVIVSKTAIETRSKTFLIIRYPRPVMDGITGSQRMTGWRTRSDMEFSHTAPLPWAVIDGVVYQQAEFHPGVGSCSIFVTTTYTQWEGNMTPSLYLPLVQ